MQKSRLCCLVVCLGCFFFVQAASAGGDDKTWPIRVRLARNEVKDYLRRKGELDPPSIHWLQDGPLQTAFPLHHFFVVRYPRLGPAWTPPKGLRHNNIFALRWDKNTAKLTMLYTEKDAHVFFDNHFKSQSGKLTSKEAHAALLAWLRFARERQQNGSLRFRSFVSFVDYRGSGRIPQVPTITGKAVVSTGGTGEILVSIDFNNVPRIERIVTKNTVRPHRK